MGGTAIYRVDAVPSLRWEERALYVPPPRSLFEGGWGLFAEDRQAVPGSIVLRGPNGLRPFQQADALEGEAPQAAVVGGTAYYIGPIMGQFGHFLVETMARLWAVPQLADGIDHFVYHGDLAPDELVARHPYVATILDALGLDRGQLVRPARPTRFERIVVPEAAFQSRSHVMPQLSDVSRTVAERLLVGAPRATTAQPAYLSKSRLGSAFTRIMNEAAVEAVLRERGVAIIHPETRGFAEQVAVVNRHETLIGAVGSAFHTVLYSLQRRNLHYIAPNERINGNYVLIDRATGHEATYYFAAAEATAVEGVEQATVLEDPAGVAETICRAIGI